MTEPKTAEDFFPGNTAAEFHMRRAVAMYKEHGEHQAKLKPITDYYDEHHKAVHHITELGDICVVEWSEQGADRQHYFSHWLNMKKGNYTGTSLESAFLIALCEKYGANADVLPYYIGVMIGMAKPKEG